MPRASTPDQRILKRLLQRSVDTVTHILDGAVATNDEGLAKVWIDALALGVDADQVQFLPTAIDHVLDAEVKFAAHDDRMRLTGELVEEVERYTVDFVVHVQALDVLAVIFHDDIDQVIDGAAVVTDEDFAVEELVVAQDAHDHLLVEAFWGGLEGDLHAAGLFRFEINISGGAVSVNGYFRGR